MIQLDNSSSPVNIQSNGKCFTSKSAPLVNEIRQLFFNEQWPKHSGI